MAKLDLKKVFIAGGTGFLGFYSALEFVKQGVKVDTISLPDIPLGDWFPKDDIGVKYGNLFQMPESELQELFTGYDALVYSVGPDDRVHPPKDMSAYDFFRPKLVDSVCKVFEAAKKAGVKKAVLLNSYFAYFDRTYPEKKLAEHHQYIRVRIEQAAETIEVGAGGAANGGMDVVVLELPYIFGSMPERMPLWKEVFLDRFAKMPAVFFPKGGTNMIHVKGIAEAVVASAYYGEHGARYPIGGDNRKYKEMIDIIMETVGSTKRCVTLPTWMCTMGGAFIKRSMKKKGIDAGLDYKMLMPDIQSKDFYFDPTEVRKQLHFDEFGYDGGGDVLEGIRTTAKACYPHRFDANGNLLDKWKGVNPTKYEPLDNDPDLSKAERKANLKKCLEKAQNSH